MSLSVGTPTATLPEGLAAGRGRPMVSNPEWDALFAAIAAAEPLWVPIEGSETLDNKDRNNFGNAMRQRQKRASNGKRIHIVTDYKTRKLYLQVAEN